MEVRVVGKRWWWDFQYIREGVDTANVLVSDFPFKQAVATGGDQETIRSVLRNHARRVEAVGAGEASQRKHDSAHHGEVDTEIERHRRGTVRQQRTAPLHHVGQLRGARVAEHRCCEAVELRAQLGIGHRILDRALRIVVQLAARRRPLAAEERRPVVVEVAEARDLLGGNGILLDHHVMRHMTDIEAIYTYELDTNPNDLIVTFEDIWVVDPLPTNPDGGVEPAQRPGQKLITLTTCSELFHTDNRMIAFGHLVASETKSQA